MDQETFKLTLKNDLSELRVLQNALEKFGRRSGIAPKHLLQINLVLEELFTNVVTCGYRDHHVHWVTVRLKQSPDVIIIEFEDDGSPFNPIKAPAPDLKCPAEKRRIGGLGIHLIKKMTDDIQYRRKGNKNILTLTKNISKKPNPPASQHP